MGPFSRNAFVGFYLCMPLRGWDLNERKPLHREFSTLAIAVLCSNSPNLPAHVIPLREKSMRKMVHSSLNPSIYCCVVFVWATSRWNAHRQTSIDKLYTGVCEWEIKTHLCIWIESINRASINNNEYIFCCRSVFVIRKPKIISNTINYMPLASVPV